ncbi:protein-disulfide reductase DsbD family protein [Flavivirga algicola]|uniref:protein-disulfide reductase DsbD family protein n=1 Tax=Flavivirga algicola TaxID=2729136 RepID=UPI001F0D0A75|nr:thioredoxin family protein [Flavivirga algicola]
MKKLVLLLALFSLTIGNSQILDPVKWTTSVEKISDTEYKLISKASIESGWHLYSQEVPEGGPIPTTFTYDDANKTIKIKGSTKEGAGHIVDDPIFEMKIKFFGESAVFEQIIEVTKNTKTISGTVEFMVCDDTRCLAPKEVDLLFNINESGESNSNKVDHNKESPTKVDTTDDNNLTEATEGGDEVIKVAPDMSANDTSIDYKLHHSKTEDISASFNLSGENDSNESDTKKAVHISLSNKPASTVNNAVVNSLLYGLTSEDLRISNVKCESEVSSSASEVQKGGKSLWGIFGLGFLGGLLALLTPCVFPMIPLTVSFFTKKSGQSKGSGISKALLYGFFIFAVYIILSIPFHLLDSVNPDILNEISTNVWLNVIFFAIFLFFAFSFFGYYELTLPSSWTNRTTQGENSGGLVGIFFMALTLAIVSFSCTGPILGSLLAGSLTSDGGAWQLTAGMAGFGVSLGLPFALFAMFPNMMNALPKSGGWLNTTKVILGFLELALAFKFLSNADLVAHWNLLKIEPFLILWIIIFGGLALYLFGKIKFPHDSPIKKLSFSRIAGGVLVAAFTIYLASGFRVNKETNTFTPLTLLSGLAPPVGYSFLYPNDCPNNLDCFKDLKTGIAYAKKVNKPIMLDFTGYACVNCRKMEEHVWSLKKIDDYLRNDYVLISLYVDDKKALPEAEQVNVNRINGGTRKLKNYGHKWANFQTQFFQNNSQPYYVLLNSDGTKILNQPADYTPDEDEYAQFLECGLKVFNESKNE